MLLTCVYSSLLTELASNLSHRSGRFLSRVLVASAGNDRGGRRYPMIADGDWGGRAQTA
jgi:hypothetical protein